MRYVVDTRNLGDSDGTSASVIASQASVGSRKMKFKGGKRSNVDSSIQGSINASGVVGRSNFMAAAAASVTLQSDVESGMDESSLGTSRSSASTRNRIFDEKFKFIKNTDKEDPSLAKLTFYLNILTGLFALIFVIGLLLINLTPSPEPYYELLNLLGQFNVKLNEVIFASRYLLLATKEEYNYGPCSFNSNNETYPVCKFVEMAEKYSHKTVANYTVLWEETVYGFDHVVLEFEEKYTKIRRPGDVLDNYIQGQFQISQFVNGSADDRTYFKLSTLWNVAGTISDAALTLESQHKINPSSQRAFNLVLANRYAFNKFIQDMIGMIPGVVTSSIDSVVLFHLILTIICVVLAVVFF